MYRDHRNQLAKIAELPLYKNVFDKLLKDICDAEAKNVERCLDDADPSDLRKALCGSRTRVNLSNLLLSNEFEQQIRRALQPLSGLLDKFGASFRNCVLSVFTDHPETDEWLNRHFSTELLVMDQSMPSDKLSLLPWIRECSRQTRDDAFRAVINKALAGAAWHGTCPLEA